ncbi:putative ABC transport system permease protein [Streptomyces sp. SAI-117]|uniref:ABC transporter permease n=1 Tax=Streptomyces sp. SAI-117 TaxID=2940546 RepID=UPI0024761E8E|nr:ABC transporter permease [Streptomyces sp. SAI-117]MDH6565483.1 putative ABC transport system permease protein [Streptomyces sp. SAI-117]
MNFVKRAGMSLRARKSRTAALLGIFVVICCLLLGGFLLEAAAARQETEAQRTVGVDVTIEGKRLTPALADRLGSKPPVTRYNPLLPLTAGAHGLDPLAPPEPKPRGGRGGGSEGGPLALRGVRDLGMLLPFAYGSAKITSGRGIVPQDADRAVAVIEKRLAAKNGLKIGDTVRVGSADGKRKVSVKVLGVFQDPRPDPSQWTPSNELPGNTLYVPAPVVERLGGDAAGLDEAVFRVGSPEQAEGLYAEAKRLLGTGDFAFRVNDKAYRDQVRPVQRVGALAGLIVRVIALAGVLILGLIVMLQIRERRHELGVLLSMGEKKWKLVFQHIVEAAVVCLPAVAVAALTGHAAGPSLGGALLDRPQRNTVAAGVPDAEVAPPTVRVDPADVGKVLGLGLGISLVSTVVPGIGILRLHPRSILADSE